MPRSSALRLDAPTQPRAASGPTEAESRGRFQLGELLGEGGMGEVRLARDRSVGREVAVKRMRGETRPDAVARFLREARVQGRLDHPAVVPLYDLGIDDHGVPFFAMKRLTGITLHDVLARIAAGDADALARWPRRLLLARLVEVCLAIEYAHTRGVIHRDLKPANVVLGDFGEVYVLDWGIARLVDADEPDREISRFGLATEDPHTSAGAGTPGYMSPEQIRGERVDPRADVYALGCILYQIVNDSHAPPELEALYEHATALDRDARLTSARALATGIQCYLDGDRDLARRRELAHEHGETALRALDAGDRAEAMREAGRALALDPEDPASQRLVGHLLLSPVDAPVAEVEAELERQRVRTGRVQLRSAVFVYALYLAAMPVLAALGVRHPGWVIALTVGIAANLFAFFVGSRRERSIASWLPLGLALHCGTLALAGIVLGPLLVTPTLVIGSIAAFLATPMIRSATLVVGAHVVAVLVPIALELAGILPRTFVLDDGGLTLRSWALDASSGVLLFVLATATVLQLIATTTLVLQLRRATDSAERRTQLQLWHLRQLLPDRHA